MSDDETEAQQLTPIKAAGMLAAPYQGEDPEDGWVKIAEFVGLWDPEDELWVLKDGNERVVDIIDPDGWASAYLMLDHLLQISEDRVGADEDAEARDISTRGVH